MLYVSCSAGIISLEHAYACVACCDASTRVHRRHACFPMLLPVLICARSSYFSFLVHLSVYELIRIVTALSSLFVHNIHHV